MVEKGNKDLNNLLLVLLFDTDYLLISLFWNAICANIYSLHILSIVWFIVDQLNYNALYIQHFVVIKPSLRII